MEVAAGGEDEERAPDCGVPFLLVNRNLLPGNEGEDDQFDVVSRPGARLRSSRA
jgi:hypothetical protein